jgi:hypothetical protein
MGLEFMLSNDITRNDREIYGAFDYIGDIGGVYTIFHVIFGFIAFAFSNKRMEALLTNRLYHVSEASAELVNSWRTFTHRWVMAE